MVSPLLLGPRPLGLQVSSLQQPPIFCVQRSSPQVSALLGARETWWPLQCQVTAPQSKSWKRGSGLWTYTENSYGCVWVSALWENPAGRGSALIPSRRCPPIRGCVMVPQREGRMYKPPVETQTWREKLEGSQWRVYWAEDYLCIDFCPLMYKWRGEKTIRGLFRDCEAQREESLDKNIERKSLLLKMIFYRK